MPPILKNVSLNPAVEAFAQQHFEIVTPETMTAEQAAQIEVILSSGKGKAPKALLDRLPNLKMIDILGVGFDGVDAAECRRRGIQLCLTSGVLTADVADLAVGLLIALLRRIPEGFDLVKSGAWEQRKLGLGHQVSGRRAGIVGLGQIGQAVALRLNAFGMEICYYDPHEKDAPYRYFADLTELAAHCDTLIVCAAASAQNAKLINAQVLKALGAEGVVVNVARGSLIDEAALVQALQQGVIAGAALDVFASEPHVPESLRSLPNVVLTPHIASATVETRRRMADIVIANLQAFMDGKPLPTALKWRD